MSATDQFYRWYLEGLDGLGGWLVFFLVAVAAVVWLLYDSSARRLPALGWRLGTVLTASLLLPTLLWRFTSGDTRSTLDPFREAIFYLGLVGGVIPPMVALGYSVTFRELVGCPQGHVFPRALGECPDASHYPASAPAASPAARPEGVEQPTPPLRGRATRPKAHAWLVSEDGRSYQLNLQVTTIGKSSRNDMQVTSDSTLSRQHAKIFEENGHFRITDLGSTNGTRVNGEKVRAPLLLEPDDVIELGDNVRFRFVAGRM